MGLFSRLAGTTPRQEPALPARVEPVVPRPMRISDEALALSRVPARSAPEPVSAWRITPPLPGVMPNAPSGGSPTLAMDYDPLYGQIGAGGFGGYDGLGEGLGFLGYPYLAELAQRPEYRRISETIAKEMTRRWVKLGSVGDDDKTDRLARLNKAMDRLRVQDRFRRCAELDGFFGRGHIFCDMGDDTASPELAAPLILDKRKVRQGSLKALRIVEPAWTYPSGYNATDPLRDDFYKPSTWNVMGRPVHASRFITMVGREMPDLLKPAYQFGGLSLSQMVKPAVDDWLRTAQSVSDLVHSFTVFWLATNMSSVLAGEGRDQLTRRLMLFNNCRDNSGAFAFDKETEAFGNISAPLAGLDKLKAQAQERMASMSAIPLVVLLCLTPSGLNASSDGEVRTFYAWIAAQQEHLFRTPLQCILDLIQLSEFGDIDPEITFSFEPLWDSNETELAAIRKTDADTAAVYIAAGVLLPEEERQRVATAEDSLYANLDLSTPLPAPESDEPGETDAGGEVTEGEESKTAADAEFEERKHPRAKNGEFSSGGSGSAAKSSTGKTEKTASVAPKASSVSSANLPTVALTVTTTRAYTGKQVETTKQLTKQESGALGEAVILAYLKHSGLTDARQLNDKATNFAVDMVAGDHCIEAKTGLVSNNDKSHHWRSTIGQPSKAQTEWLKSASPEEKSAWTQNQYVKIMERKEAARAEVSRDVGRTLGKKTVTTILNPDTNTADVYVFDGFHLRIGWKGPDAEKSYVGSFRYG